MMTGLDKVNHDLNKTSSEPSLQKPVGGVRAGRVSPGTKALSTPHTLNTTPTVNHFSPPHHTSSLLPPLPASEKPTHNYHIARPTCKIQDWFFKAKKTVLVLGDSNINHIPGHIHSNIQLDSYPGANTYHFLKSCEKTLPNPHVKILIISIGINNKDQDPKQTSKQLKALFHLAKSTFPNADIYFPIMNYSPHLTPTQKSNLKLINNTMATHFSILTEIPHDTFKTEKDNIHWTPSTAKLIFENWLNQLNL
ncbi:hypothetical protein ABVT39_000831 [Epinephelus coioides]